jgi:hypothetical protein
MNKSFFAALMAGTLSFVSASASAATHNSHRSTSHSTISEQPVTTSQSAPDRVSSGGSVTWGLGVSSVNTVPFPGNVGSLTAIFHLTTEDAIQVLLSIPSTQGSFKFGAGGLYKRTVAGSQAAGFHLGGGVALGTNGSFAASFIGVAGIHYTPSGTNLAFHFDGGPALTIQDTNGGSSTNFAVGQYSNVLGASVLYVF